MPLADACLCREPLRATLTLSTRPPQTNLASATDATTADGAGQATLHLAVATQRPCSDASLLMRLWLSAMDLTALTGTTCSAVPTATSAANRGPLTILASGILMTLSAAARSTRSERLSSLIRDAKLSTAASVELTAESASCLGKLAMLLASQDLLLTADANAHGEQNSA